MRPSAISNSSTDILDNFKNPEIARKLVGRIQAYRAPVAIMEVCGTHTMALFRTGVRAALPENIRLVSGPGCPACVTPPEAIETAIGLACKKDTVLFCFGDMMRIPAASGSLESVRASRGARVKVMYSPREALDYARREPRHTVVLFGIGFETTIPLFASVILRAREENIGNLFLLDAFRLIPPAILALLSHGDISIDGFLLPGHVSSIIGERPYGFMPAQYRVPGVITGFEATDMLEGILMLLEMIRTRRPAIRNQYSRFVPPGGNRKARAVMQKVFDERNCDAVWRGLGIIRDSGLRLGDEFKRFDAAALVDFPVPAIPEPEGCICGEVIRGTRTPQECARYGGDCAPAHPAGPCMVSSEGTCAAHYNYGGRNAR